MPDIAIQSAKTADRIDFMSKTAKMQIANKIGLSVNGLNDKDVAKLADLQTKTKKPVDFVISFDGQWFSYFSRVGSAKDNITKIDVGNYPGIDKEKVLKNLVMFGAATKAQADAFKKKNP